jgi:hypothetical protein
MQEYTMRFPIFIPLGFVVLISNNSCQPVQVVARMEHNYQPEAKAYLVGEVIWVEVKIPLVSGIDSWHATFDGETPEGFSTKSNARETIFTWIVAKDRITWFGTNGYILKLTGGEHSRSVKVMAINQSANVAQWIVRILALGIH